MPLSAGQTLTHYEILGPLGAGGMGEVYRAKDTRLEREVAIKVLPEDLADDQERLRRFEREAKTLASLNHPNVAGIHGVDHEGDVYFLALELVPGEDLGARLKRGALPVAEAIDVCRQIAEGLEAAHEAGVIHRDLKPANVRVTPDGVVKMLDFGLAKPIRPKTSSESGTTTAESDSFLMTEEGIVLGTPTYMSPEQARGKPVDRRTDIWAFGCVLYECLTGRRVFAGESLTDVLAAIVEREPDWSKLPAAVPADVRRLQRRCLQKDPRVRLRDIGEARVVLAGDAAAEVPGEMAVGAKAPVLPFVAGLVVASVVWLGFTFLRPDEVAGPEGAARAYHLTLARNRLASPGLISPDGSRFLFAQEGELWVRDLAELEPRRLLEMEGQGRWAQWSHDGDSIAFAYEGSLEVLRLGETRSQRRYDLTQRVGNGSWGDDGSFLLEMGESHGVHLLPPGSSTLEHLDWLETEGRVLPDHVHPSFLPGSEEFLVTLAEEAGAWIHVASLKTRSTRKLVRAGSRAVYVHPGWLAWVDEGRLLVQRFDAATATVSGTPHELVGDVSNFASTGHASFSFSREGTLLYQPWSGPARIEWVDREGRPHGPAGEPRHYSTVRLDPTGRFLATSIVTPETSFRDLWIIDLERDTPQRLTHEDGWESTPVWSPDGEQIAFAADRYGPPNIYVKPTDGGEARELVPFDSTVHYCASWTPDGRSLVYVRFGAGKGDIWSVDVKTLERRRLLETPFDERDVQLSPDGRWLAYSSDESGREEVYVASFPDLAGRRRVSAEGGDQPRWRADSEELFFRTGSRAIASVTIEEREGRAEPGRETLVIQESDDLSDFDVTPDGSRFLLVRANEGSVRPVSHVITRWQRLLEK
jgi:Tol biopolymer transport system component